MPVVQRWTGSALVWCVEAPTIETRDDALGCEVRRADVDPYLVEEIERTVRMASLTLGLDCEPRLRWLPADTKNLRGVTFGAAQGEIWVRVGPLADVHETALHELRHVQQVRTLAAVLDNDAAAERDADDFAKSWRWDQTPTVVDQAAGRRLWEQRYAPLHEATAAAYAERATHRRSPMLRASPAPSRQLSASGSIRQERKTNGGAEIQCEQCGAWVRLNVTHSCPAARRQTSATGYVVKVVR